MEEEMVSKQKCIEEKLKQMQKEYEKKERKLKKNSRKRRAKEHVKKTLREQASLLTTVPVDNSGTNEVAHNLESNPKEDDSLDSVNRTAHSNAQQTQERNIELACENDKGVRKELKGEGTIVDQRKNVKHFAIAGGNNETDTRAADEHLGSADLSVHPSNDIMAVSADENSCSQDIFSSPKPASRNLFEDLQKTILNRNEGDTSYSRQTSDLVSNDNLTSVSEQIKEVRNTATETNYNKDNISQYSNNVSKGINSSFGFSDCANHSSIPTEAVKGTRDNKKDKDKSKNETADYYSVKLLASTELDKTGKASSMDTVHNFTSPINSLNSSSETKSKLLKEIGEDAMEITETVVKNQKANTEAVLAVSETPTDSDWTIPSSIDLDDFVNVKSRSRTRRSSSAKRRQSLRIAELSSQESSQSNSDSLLSDLYVSSHKQKAKHTDKILEVSSIFQCLLDEANRDNTNSEFSLPPDFSEEFKSLQLVNENKISEVFMQTESNNDTEAQCIHEDIKMQESELLPSKENSTTDDAELGLNGKTDCKEEAEREQKQHFIDKCTDVNSAETTASITDRYNKITSSSSELQVQVNHAMEEDGEDNQSSENILCMSPPLFESQPDKCITDTDTDSKDADIDTDNYSSPQVTVRGMKVGSRASPAGTAVLPGDQEEAAQTVGLSLEQAHIFQVPKTDQLVSLVMGETNEKLHIVCLCSANLRFYEYQNNQWFCYHSEKLGFLVKKNSGCSVILVPDTAGSGLCVVLQQRKTDSVKLTLYVSSDTRVNSYHVDSLWSRSVLLCPSNQGEFIASYVTDQKTYLTKYTVTDNNDVQRKNFEPVLDEITSLCSIRDQEAILGLSVTSQLYVWNSRQMSLLTTVDVSDVSLQDMMCSHAFYEEGFLFLTVFSKRKCRQAGSVLVVNPQMGTCETLTALENRNEKWTGYSTALLVQEEYIIVRENSGSLSVWDLYTGKLVSTLKETNLLCVAASHHSVALCHKQCVHVYNIEDSGD